MRLGKFENTNSLIYKLDDILKQIRRIQEPKAILHYEKNTIYTIYFY